MCRYGWLPWSTPSRDKISAAPPRCSPNTRPVKEIVYPENNREVMPKLWHGSELTMKTNHIYAPLGCPNDVDNSKHIRFHICKELHISNHISFERETTKLRDLWAYAAHLYMGLCITRKERLLMPLTYGLDDVRGVASFFLSSSLLLVPI